MDGLYTPPSLTGSHRITATLVANASVSGSATVDITGFQGTLTWRNDNARSGINGQELALSPATVNPNTFGILFRCPVDGYVYAQPLNIANLPMLGIGTHNVVIVATENDSIYAFDADADSCKQLWKTSLAPAGTQAIDTRSFQINNKWYISPTVGITGTPVIGGLIPTLYVVAASQSGAPGSTYSQQLYALDLTTVPPEIQPAGIGITAPAGQAPGFAQPLGIQRPALLLDHGTVYVAFGSNGGSIEYHGWLFGYDTSSLQQTGAFNVTQPPATQGGIWQSGGGPSADPNDPNHYIFVTTGDGPFNADRTMYSFSYSDSFLRLGTVGGLSVSDYFTPCDQATLETEGLDVGASAPVLLPDAAGSSPQSHLLIGGSKAGSLYVVNRDNMGKFTPSPPPPPQCSDSPVGVQTIPVGTGPILSTPLFWDKAVYVTPGNGHLMSFPMSGVILSSPPSESQSPEKTLGPQGATPVIS